MPEDEGWEEVVWMEMPKIILSWAHASIIYGKFFFLQNAYDYVRVAALFD